MMMTSRVLVFIFIVLGLRGLAHCEELPSRVGILSLETTQLSKTEKELFVSSLEEGLVGLGYQVIKQSNFVGNPSEYLFVVGCRFGPCTKVVFNNTGVRSAIVANMKKEGSSYSIVISHLDTKESTVVSQVAEVCEICTVEEAMLSVTNATIAVMTETGEAEALESKAKPSTYEKFGGISKPSKMVGIRKTGIGFLAVGALSITAGLLSGSASNGTIRSGLLGFGLGSVLGGSGLLFYSRTF